MKYTILFPLLLFCSFVSQNELTGKVVRVADGDTFTLLTGNNKQVKVRIYGIDAPESGQAYSEKSRLFLAELLTHGSVTITEQSTDQYGRTIAKVTTKNTPDVGLEMIKAGLAWHYSFFDNTKAYIDAQQAAKEKELGIWADKSPVNPYEYRKQKKR